MRRLDTAKWPHLCGRPTVLVPLGSTEQHGPHLPIGTDTMIAEAVAEGVAERLGPGTLVAPVVAYGASGEHQSFPGTCSIGHDALELMLVELVRSLSTWADRTVIVNAHGGNWWGLEAAVRTLISERHSVAWVACATESVDLHAGHTETSLMLHLRPDTVDRSGAVRGNTAALPTILPSLLEGGVAAVSPSGVLGDPSTASADEGDRILADLIADVVDRVRHGQPDGRGCLCSRPVTES